MESKRKKKEGKKKEIKNEHTKQKQTHRNRGQRDGCQREENGGMGEKGKGNIVNNIVISLHSDR